MRDIHEMISAPEYNFLRENEHLGDRLALLAFGGSYAHGTATEESDVILRGCAINSASDLLGMSNFDRYLDHKTETEISSVFRLVQRLLSADFPALELLGTKPEHFAVISPVGRQLLDNRQLFFTRQTADAYCGFVTAMEQWLDGASARAQLGQSCNENTLAESCESATRKFNRKFRDLPGNGGAKLYVDRTDSRGMSVEVFMDVDVHHCPLRDYTAFLSALQNIIDTSERTAKHRRAIDKPYIAKKMCTLVRMLYTCCDLLETGQIVTCREKERELLLEIRSGAYVLPQSRIAPEFKDIIEPLKKRIAYGRENCVLPEQFDLNAVNGLLMELHRNVVLANA